MTKMSRTRKKLFAGNWKMYKSISESKEFLQVFAKKLSTESDYCQQVEFAILSQGPLLLPLHQEWTKILQDQKELKNFQVAFGAQNIYWQKEGAFTGELSPELAKEIGCDFALCGHSERRQFFGETNETAAKRALAAHSFGMRAIFCVGENLKEREEGNTFSVLEKQSKELVVLATQMPEGIVIAYEPVWAIGTGKNATAEEVEAVHRFLRDYFSKVWGAGPAQALQILYGGSVKPQNSRELLSCPNVDGVLVGGASLDPKSLFEIALSIK